MNRMSRIAMVVAAFLLPVHARAQEPPAAQISLKRWDLSGSIGLLWSKGQDNFPYSYDFLDFAGAYGLNTGHYWTNHLKTELGVTLAGSEFVETGETLRVPGFPISYSPSGPFVTSRLTTLSAVGTYQFFENVFAHPYVSAGFRLGWLGEHRFRAQGTSTFVERGVRYTFNVPMVDARNTSLLVKPLVAGGFKSYFNERTFIRSEILITFGSHGPTDVTFGLGIGVDF